MLSDVDFEGLVQSGVECLNIHTVEIKNVVLFNLFVSELHNEVASNFKRSLTNQSHFVHLFTIR